MLGLNISSAFFCIFSFFFAMSAALAQGFGPRAYQLVPDGSNILSLYGMYLNGNQGYEPGSVFKHGNVDVNLAAAQYTRAFNIAGNQGAVFAVLPYGRTSGSLETNIGLSIDGKQAGLFDAQIGVVYGIIGSPALSLPAYAKFQPGFALGVLSNVYVPIGEYHSDQVLNPGTNRWAAQFGFPMSYSIGKSFLAPNLSTIELLPSVTMFGDNDNPFGQASRTGQRLLFELEGHITRNLNRMIWLSLDTLYAHGGETTTNGTANNDVQDSFSIGGTFNINVSPSISLKASYGNIVYHNKDAARGNLFRVAATYAF